MTLDVLVVGGGVVGLSVASELSAAGRSVAVLERRPRAGMETSTHNSGVIHAGLYYPQGTLKAHLCIEGAARLYAFCGEHRVPHDRCGKLVVAVNDTEVPQIEAIEKRGKANGAEGLEIVDRGFIRAREPHVAGVAALWSPNTGRVEPEALVKALLTCAESHDSAFLKGTALIGGEPLGDGFRIRTEQETIDTAVVVNAAGLDADDVSAMLGGESFTIYPCRGEYAQVRRSKAHYVNGLVYPLPHGKGHGLGVHLTKTIGGDLLLGPTVRFQDRKDDHESDRLGVEEFLEPARMLLPETRLEDLALGGTGIRPKLHPASESFADFMIRPDQRRPALIHAAGIESPGLTACLAIGARVGRLVQDVLN